MAIARSRRNEKAYRKYLANNKEVCAFCSINKGHPQYIAETKSFKVVRNDFPYKVWNRQVVIDHLMVIPKKHIRSLAELTADEAAEYVKLIGGYEQRGYHMYARATNSATRSFVHQHTHLIQGDGRLHRFLLFVYKPYVLISR